MLYLCILGWEDRHKAGVGTLNGLGRFRTDVLYSTCTACTAVGSNSYGGADVCSSRVPSQVFFYTPAAQHSHPSARPLSSPALHMMRFIPPGASSRGWKYLGCWVVGRTSSDSRLCDVARARQFSSLSRSSRPPSRPPRARMVEISNLFSVPAQHFLPYTFRLQPPSPASFSERD